MLRRRLPHGSCLLALVALLAALVVAGCGGDDATTTSDDGPDPATLAPADAFLYGEVVLRPTGAAEEGARIALRKVLRVEDPGAEIVRLLDDAWADDGDDVSYAADVEPWLGERGGGWVRFPAGGDTEDPDWAIALAADDVEALEAADARFRDAGSQRRAGTYKGIAYDLEDDGDSYSAIVGDFYVGGNLAGLRAAIDASSGDSLADASRFEDASDDIADDALAFLYLDPGALDDALSDVDDAPAQARETLRRFQDADPVVASLTATADEIAIEATADNAVADLADADGSDAEVTVGQLPGDAWLALATPPLGPIVEQALDAAGFHGEAAQQLRQAMGLDLDRDLLDPLGGLGLFVRGSNPLDIGGGALLQLTDEASAERLMTRIQALVGAGLGVAPRSIQLAGGRGFEVAIPQSPQPIVVVQKGDRIAAGYAASSARDLLDPQQRFDESADGSAAIGTLGDDFEPSFVLIVPPVARLLGSLDQLQVADLSDVIPYVEAYESLAVGTKRDDDETTVRAVAALR